MSVTTTTTMNGHSNEETMHKYYKNSIYGSNSDVKNDPLGAGVVLGNDNDNNNNKKILNNDLLIPMQPVVKDYAWGIRGMDSRVARYALENKAVDDVDPDTPYAELWVGTHPKGPAKLIPSGETLRDAIGDDLPFLFKVLSAGKALSIQAHPDKELAQQLHQDNPTAYGDPNHKPEMAIALTPFEAMCGFRQLEEVSILIKKHPEFANCISTEAKLAIFLSSDNESKKSALQKLFHSFMSCPPEISEKNLKLLLVRLQAEQSYLHPHPHDEPAWERKCARAILRLAQQFPNDPGAMSPLFLNYLLIAPGESFFMAANEPHAYVAGEIIECMACSDNVVRAGLTPKFKDVDNLVKMLTYSMGGPSIDVGAPVDGDSRVLRYTPPVPEFEVMMLSIDPGDQLTLPNPNTPAVMMVLEGRGKIIIDPDSGSSGDNDSKEDESNSDKNNDNGKVVKINARPGQCYYWPADSVELLFAVSESRRGPMKITIAHKNCHLSQPTAVNRGAFGLSSHQSTVPPSPMPYLGLPSPGGTLQTKMIPTSATAATNSNSKSNNKNTQKLTSTAEEAECSSNIEYNNNLVSELNELIINKKAEAFLGNSLPNLES